MNRDIQRILVDEARLSERVNELGRAMTADYAGREPLIVGILRGSFIFMADLVRVCDFPCTVDFMVVSSYGGGATSSGNVRILKDLSEDISGRDVILVEDILDTGRTLYNLRDVLSRRGPASIRIAALLDKPERRAADITADYVGFTVPNEFVVGYGLDYDQRYRTLPYIGILKPEVYTSS